MAQQHKVRSYSKGFVEKNFLNKSAWMLSLENNGSRTRDGNESC